MVERADVGDASDLAGTLQGIAAAAQTALGADRASLYVIDVDTQNVESVYTTETDPRFRAVLERAAGRGADQLPIWQLHLSQPDPVLAIEDAGRDPAISPELAARLGSGALLGVRLEHASVWRAGVPALLGTLFCSYANPRRFSTADRQAARGFARLATLTLANARLQAQTARSLAAAALASAAIQRERDYSAALVASMRDGLTVLSPAGVVIEVSPSFSQMTGFARAELIGQGCPYPYWPEAEPGRLERGFRRIREAGTGEWDLEYRRKSGELFPVIVGGSLLRGQDGEVLGYLATIKDITERKHAEQELRRSAAENQVLAADQAALRRVATRVAAEAPPRDVFRQTAEEVASLLGVELGLVARFESGRAVPIGWCGAPIDVALPLDGGGALAQVARTGQVARVSNYTAIADNHVGALVDSRGYRSGVAAPVRVGGQLWGALLAATTRPTPIDAEAEARLERFAELVALAIANAEAQARLVAQATNDPLTGLANHRTFFERLDAEVGRARRRSDPLGLVIFDVDHFKRVNDIHGHLAGDGVLMDVAARLASLARAEDTLARIGGEEFAWLMPDTDGRAAWLAGERARREIADAPFATAGKLTVSAGAAELREGMSVTELFRRADAALYWAKDYGRNACMRFTPAQERALKARPANGISRLAAGVERLVAQAQEQIGLTATVLTEVHGGTLVVRQVAGDADAFELRVGREIPLSETYCEPIVEGGGPQVVRDAQRERGRASEIAGASPIGAYVGVPVTLPSGDVYGTLCCLSRRAEPGLGAGDARTLGILAGFLAEELEFAGREATAQRVKHDRLRGLLTGDGLEVVLQPIVELTGGQVVAVEALSRFDVEPGYAPARWFADAASLGLGTELELLAIRRALEHLDELPRGVRLSVNVSPATLCTPEFTEALDAFPGQRLAIEITEHAPVEDYAALRAALTRLRSRGAQLMVDDAGAGFASLKHIVDLKPDVIKLDLSLTRDIDTDPLRRALAASLLAFADEIGASIVAEGIETVGELEALRALGVKYGQGYLISRPGTAPVPDRVSMTSVLDLANAPLT